ncbi:MAG TPA: hypothetical protein VMZ03_01715, partial [Chitinophagaceae bacterium]|nr:hypothetical protein [Chitinophagaceae bacterium]
KIISHLALIPFLFFAVQLNAQQVDSIRFFTDEQTLEMELTTDIKSLQGEKGQDVFQPATVKIKFPDGKIIEEVIQVGARGKFRRGYCRIPPIMMQFRNASSPQLASLGKLKLVIGCGASSTDEELLFKEFLVYKIYNQITPKSFRVRLIKTTYNDTRGRVRSFSQHSFMLEDDGDMARRNGCFKKVHGQLLTEATERDNMTMVAVFEYMIGNTDWSVPNEHNIEIIFNREKPLAPPLTVPYDFDYCGLVDASYAVPNEIIGTEKVTERVYRGFPRSMEELQQTLALFRSKKEAIYSVIRNFTMLGERARRGMINYLDEFYRMIEKDAEVRFAFIENARKN